MDESVLKLWNPEDVKSALEALRSRIRINIAQNFNVPESTIRNRLKLEQDFNPSMGREINGCFHHYYR